MGTKVRPADTDEAAAPTVATTEEIEHAEPAATVPPAVPLSLHDYSCPICLELLLRPVKLSCGHHFCRGCWVRVLQSRDGRAAANTTGSAACPFRCEVRPVVPEVDQALASELESHFDEEYTERASAYALPDEERKAAEVNAWAAAGCVLDTPEDESATLDEVAAAVRAQQLLHEMALALALSGSGFVCLLGLLLLCIMTVREMSVQLPVIIVLLGMAAGLALLDAIVACYMIEQQRTHRISVSSLLLAFRSIVWSRSPAPVLDEEIVAVYRGWYEGMHG